MNEFPVDFLESNRIGIIGDSRVYPFELEGHKKVIKIFAFGPPDSFVVKTSLQQVIDYKSLTDFTIPVVNNIQTTFNTKKVQFTWEVTPIDEVGEYPFYTRLAPYSLSSYVDGLTMEDDTEFIDTLSRIATEEKMRFDLPSADLFFLRDATNQLRKLTGRRAIKLAAVNLKPQKRDDGYHIRITDLCSQLDHLSYP